MNILFVCHGNICRSVMAEMIFKNLDINHVFNVSSCATSSEEIGNPIYPPIKDVLLKNNIKIDNHLARKLTTADGDSYDLIIGMDYANINNIIKVIGEDNKNKVYLLNYFLGNENPIDDPWYTREFDRCFNEINEGCKSLYNYLIERM